tara:strand:+ start:392 stop:1348 length:957 start_codon:yes stop_codon:yes gene_type:complete
MNKFKFYIGPMSKNVVDAVIEFTEETNNKIGFIPSRRQVEYNGGYVNNWTTEEFSDYVDGRVPIERDHGGAGQGYKDDDGYKSFRYDCENFDIIHIDPWKAYPNFDDGLKETLATINYIHNMNPNTLFEVGTEEAIRKFTPDELDKLLEELSHFEFFENIKYAVVQSGVGLDLGKRVNTGNFDLDRLKDFIRVCKRWGKLSKEHNGDYLTNEDVKVRFEAGLDSLNIAPEFGQLETLCYLEHMGDDIEDYYKICYDSKRWEKWVDDDFVPEDNKEELIKICGHYVLSDKKFLETKPDIDKEIKSKIKDRLDKLLLGVT